MHKATGKRTKIAKGSDKKEIKSRAEISEKERRQYQRSTKPKVSSWRR